MLSTQINKMTAINIDTLVLHYSLGGYTIKYLSGTMPCLSLPVVEPYKDARLAESAARFIKDFDRDLIKVDGGYILPLAKIAKNMEANAEFMGAVANTKMVQ